MSRKLAVAWIGALSLALCGVAAPGAGAANRPAGGGALIKSASAASDVYTFVAMGDSYSSGEGNPPFDPGTFRKPDTCDRSQQAWPVLEAKRDDIWALTRNISCSGARTENITTTAYSNEQPQIQQLEQLKQVGPAPQMVTITIGGNDAGFKDVLTACYASNGYPCWATLLAAEGRVKRSLPQELQSTYTAVQAAAGPQAGLVAVGYPKIFPDSYSLSVAGHCGWLRFEEWAAIRKISADLEAAQKVAAAKAGVLFHSVQSVLKGHELCTADSWVKSVSAVNREYSAHPLLKGQQAIADDMYTWLGR